MYLDRIFLRVKFIDFYCNILICFGNTAIHNAADGSRTQLRIITV